MNLNRGNSGSGLRVSEIVKAGDPKEVLVEEAERMGILGISMVAVLSGSSGISKGVKSCFIEVN